MTPTEQSVIILDMRQASIEKRNKILEAASLLIADGGMEGLSMSKLAKLSAVPQATSYVYFASKEVLLKELFTYTEEYICQYIVNGFDMSQPVKECFQEYSRRMIQLGRDHRDKILVHEQFLATQKSRNLDLQQVVVFYEPLYEFVERGQREGLIKGGAPIVILSYFSMPINGILFGDMIWQNTPEQIWYDWLFSMSWDAIRVHKD